MKLLIELVLVLFAFFFGFQTYQLYQEKALVEKELNQVAAEYSAQKLFTKDEVRGRIASTMEAHGVEWNKDTFPLELDEAKLLATFSLDFKKSPSLFLMKIPFSFHIDVPTKAEESGGPASIIGAAKKTVGGVKEAQEKKLEKVEEVSGTKAAADKKE